MASYLKTYFVWSPECEIELAEKSEVYAHTREEAAEVAVREWKENYKGKHKGVIPDYCDVFVLVADRDTDKPKKYRVRVEQVIEYIASPLPPE